LKNQGTCQTGYAVTEGGITTQITGDCVACATGITPLSGVGSNGNN